MTFYQVHNTSRRSETRGQRYQNPTHRGYKQFVGGHHRIVTGRALLLSEEQICRYRDELQQKVSMGLVIVTTLDGRDVALDDARFLSAAPMPPTAPLPVRRSDSIANDDPWGSPVETLPGTDPVIATDFTLPPSIGVSFDAEPAAAVEAVLPPPSIQYVESKKSKKRRE